MFTQPFLVLKKKEFLISKIADSFMLLSAPQPTSNCIITTDRKTGVNSWRENKCRALWQNLRRNRCVSNFVFDIYFNSASQMCLIFMRLQSQLSLACWSQRGALFTSATASFLFLPSNRHKTASVNLPGNASLSLLPSPSIKWIEFFSSGSSV